MGAEGICAKLKEQGFTVAEQQSFFDSFLASYLLRSVSTTLYKSQGPFGIHSLFGNSDKAVGDKSLPRRAQACHPFLLTMTEDKKHHAVLFYADQTRRQVMVCGIQVKASSRRGGVQSISLDSPIETNLADIGGRGHEYPSIVEFKGCAYAVGPANSNNNGIALFTCVEFPRVWKKAAVISSTAKPMRPTLIQHDGQLWVFNTRRMDTRRGATLGAYSGRSASLGAPALDAYYASVPTGPWTSHAHNPIVTGPAHAVMAGSFIRHGDVILRPALDCTLHFGARVRLMRVTMLSSERFAETEDHNYLLSELQASGHGKHALGASVVAAARVRGLWIGAADLLGAPATWRMKRRASVWSLASIGDMGKVLGGVHSRTVLE